MSTETSTPTLTLALSYNRAASAVGCSRRTIERAISAGQLRAVAISPRRRVISYAELEQWLVNRTIARGGASR